MAVANFTPEKRFEDAWKTLLTAQPLSGPNLGKQQQSLFHVKPLETNEHVTNLCMFP
jgi:hypothetical protein